MQAKSRILGELHETISDLHEQGFVDKKTMRNFDVKCLIPELTEYNSESIKNLRQRLNISQSVLAQILNVSTVTAQKWEYGSKKPSGAAQKLLNILDKKGVEIML